MVELIISIVVIGVALAGVLVVMVRNTQASADPMIWHQSVSIAEAYLEEILTKNYAADGVEASRDQYDDIMDYNGLIESPPRDQMGNPIAALAGYTVQVTVVTTESLNGIVVADVRRVEVTVSPPAGGGITISGYRTNYN